MRAVSYLSSMRKHPQLLRLLAGNWVADEHEKITDISLEQLERRLTGDNVAAFLRLMRSMLRWLPEERKTARELLDDPWLNA